ncbi:hypothetical protein [Psychrilyobacter atlanticus]|uniref:hypothetical protein n=1 Tax=Psychrilyobacter atlanticus TaxID=271091 RepID=UPI0003FACEE1|nr:hypothetical protein [Psychrilyobacter atlanticus]
MKRGVLNDDILVELEQIIPEYLPFQHLKLLRFLPFIDHTVKNKGIFKKDQVTREEFEILSYLVEKRHLDLSLLNGQAISSIINPKYKKVVSSMINPKYKIKIRDYKFYNLMQRALWFSYVERRLPWEK